MHKHLLALAVAALMSGAAAAGSLAVTHNAMGG